MANTVNKVIAIAQNEVGYLEKSATAYKKNPAVLDKKTEGAGSDNYTKYGRDMHKVYPAVMDFPAYWCDAFVDWCFYTAYGIATAKSLLGGNFDDYTVASATMYSKKGAWHKASETPEVGDQIFFVKSGTKQEIGNICHTGLVYKVTSTRVYTIEGNTSGGNTVVANGGGVAYKDYPLNYSRIAGYGRPKYDKSTTTVKSDSAKATNADKKSDIPTLASATPNLKKGSTGKQVGYLQQDLKYLGFKGKNGKVLTVDESFGENTDYALRAFQTKYKLIVDGVYGNASKSKMSALLK
jgi:hypothetical protein